MCFADMNGPTGLPKLENCSSGCQSRFLHKFEFRDIGIAYIYLIYILNSLLPFLASKRGKFLNNWPFHTKNLHLTPTAMQPQDPFVVPLQGVTLKRLLRKAALLLFYETDRGNKGISMQPENYRSDGINCGTFNWRISGMRREVATKSGGGVFSQGTSILINLCFRSE